MVKHNIATSSTQFLLKVLELKQSGYNAVKIFEILLRFEYLIRLFAWRP